MADHRVLFQLLSAISEWRNGIEDVTLLRTVYNAGIVSCPCPKVLNLLEGLRRLHRGPIVLRIGAIIASIPVSSDSTILCNITELPNELSHYIFL